MTIVIFQFKKGFLTHAVQAGLLITLATQLAACGEQPAPVDAAPAARVASASPDASDTADMPEIVVTATRGPKSEI